MSERQYTWFEILVQCLRLITHIAASTAAMMCGAEALRHYTNFPILAGLPVGGNEAPFDVG